MKIYDWMFLLDLEYNFERIKGVICSVVSPNEITSIDDIDVELPS